MDELWRSAALSLRVAALATAAAVLVAVPAGYALARRPFRGRTLIEGLLTLPLVLPPTVVGYGLVLLLGRGGLGGLTGAQLLFTEPAAALAAAAVALPLVYLPSRAAFAAVPREMEEAAVLAGAGRWAVFRLVYLPAARRGVAAGIVLGFARALGEFGATVMVFGAPATARTLPVEIWFKYQDLQMTAALPAALVLAGLSLAAIWIYGRVGRGEE